MAVRAGLAVPLDHSTTRALSLRTLCTLDKPEGMRRQAPMYAAYLLCAPVVCSPVPLKT